ncbi:MAG TPA: hypothetical protein ENN60_01620 [archaeon]|nr:hypothetical protein [archaeon]
MRRGISDNIWLFLGVVMLLLIMATFSPTSKFGKAFLGLRKSVEGVFGGGATYCPFINPYAMSIFAAGELEISGKHALCDPVEYTLSVTAEGLDPPATLMGDNYNYTDGNCTMGRYSISLSQNSSVNVSGQAGGYASFSQDQFFGLLNDYQLEADLQNNLGGDNKVAVQLITQKMPSWQCLLIYGILPFFIIFNLLNDVLVFTFFKTATRKLIAAFGSLIAVMTGAFAQLVTALGSFVGITIGQSFLLLMLGLALVSVFLAQLSLTAEATSSTLKSVKQALEAGMSIASLNKGLKVGQEEEEKKE